MSCWLTQTLLLLVILGYRNNFKINNSYWVNLILCKICGENDSFEMCNIKNGVFPCIKDHPKA